MKKTLWYLLALAIISSVVISCSKDDDAFDETLLYGKWQSGTVFYKYLPDHTGGTWDISEDISEDEASKFTWTLLNSELKQIYIIDLGGTVPKTYTVTQLTASTLKYKDAFGSSFSFNKVQ
jgi:hypothetical protein